MTHRWVIPLFHGTPQAVETSQAMWDVPHGWAVPVWLGCPILAGVSQFGWVVPAVGHPTLKRAVPRQVGRPSALWDVPRGWAVPVWVGCPEFAGLSQFCLGRPSCGSSQQVGCRWVCDVHRNLCIHTYLRIITHPVKSHAPHVLLVVLVEPSTCNTI